MDFQKEFTNIEGEGKTGLEKVRKNVWESATRI